MILTLQAAQRSKSTDLFVLLTPALMAACLQTAVFLPEKASAQENREMIVPPPIALHITDEKSALHVAPLRTLSLKACFDRAEVNNQEIAAARLKLPISQAALQSARAIPNPRFSMQYGFGPQFSVIIAGNPQQLGWQFDIQTAGKRSKNIDLCQANCRVKSLTLDQVIFDVHNRVRRAYAEQAAAEAYAELIEAQREVSSQLAQVAERRFSAGKAPRAELLQAQLGVMQFDTQRNLAQTRLQQASAALSLLIGELPDRIEVIDVDDNGIFKLSNEKTEIVPSPERALPPLSQLLSVSYRLRPDLRLSIQQEFSDKRALSLAKAQRIPDLFLDTGFQFTSFKRFQPYNLVGSSPSGQAFPTPNSPGCYLNVTCENPIFYQHQGEVAHARATWLQDFDQTAQLRAQVAADVVAAYESAAGSKANIARFQKDLIPQASLIAKQARRRYEAGKADLSSAILARQQYQQILQSYFDAVVAYQNAWADLEKAVGAPLQL